MRGIVAYTIKCIGWIAIRNEHGEITLAELTGPYEMRKGDAITGNLHTLGHEVFINHSAGEYIDVFIHHVRLTDQQAIDVIRTTPINQHMSSLKRVDRGRDTD